MQNKHDAGRDASLIGGGIFDFWIWIGAEENIFS
jgi:hypothetical protein